MFCKEDITIPKELLNIDHFYIYDTITDKYGLISNILLSSTINGICINYYAYFDIINTDVPICYNDFINGRIKFVILTDNLYKSFTKNELDTIKNFLKTEFIDDYVIYISDEERQIKLKEQERKEKEKIGKQINWAESATLDFILESYSAQKLIYLCNDEIINEQQMLYELINIIAAQRRSEKDAKLKIDVEELKRAIKESKDLIKQINQKEEK